MGERRILLIGSQCDRLNHLSFLPKVAEDLYEVMIDPQLGECVPAPETAGLLLDPSVDTSMEAIETAFRRASQDEATLFLVFIGHGEYAGEDFYLLPIDASIPPRAHSAIHLVQLIKELHREHSFLDGLIVLIDTCYAGVAATGAAAKWVGELQGTLRFEMLTAVADRPAADGCFSKSLAHAIRTGVGNVPSEYLRCEKVKPVIEKLCPKQTPHLPTWDSDDGLYLAKNVARFSSKDSWIGTRAAAEIERLVSCFQPTPQLEELVEATEAKRYVALTGLAGTGKSALAAALARPELTEGKVPEAFVQAVAFISEGMTSGDVAYELSKQLGTAFPAFAQARAQFHLQVREEELAQLDTLQREVLRPLQLLRADRPLRIVLDGLDSLLPGAVLPLSSVLEALATDPELAAVRLVVTCRPDTPLPAAPEKIEMDRTDDRSIALYLERRGTPLVFHESIVQKARGNWLIARLLADVVSSPPSIGEEALPRDPAKIYDRVLRRAGATDYGRWRNELRPVLSVLAAAGVGPVLPVQLLCAASERQGGPSRPTRVRDVLVDVRGFIARGKPGTNEERVGVFHQTFAEYLLNPAAGEFGSEAREPHTALLDAIAELAPMEQHDMRSPLHRYAAAAEAEHFWAIGKHSEAITSLSSRASNIPAENLARWKNWFNRVDETLGRDHPDTLRTRSNIAAWTGEAGDSREALRLFQELFPDRERVLGSDHLDTLRTRHNIAHWIGQTGDGREALRLFQDLLPDRERVLGPNHPDTLRSRNNIAAWTGQTGDGREALRFFQELLPDRERVLGPNHLDTLRTRNNIAYWTGQTGDGREALRLFQELLPDQEKVLGPNHPDTLRTRHKIAYWTGQTGDGREALRLFQELLPDQDKGVRPRSPRHAAYPSQHSPHWIGQTGDGREALRLFQELLPDQEKVLGPNHPDTLRTRHKIAYWTGQTGDGREALRLFQELLPDQEKCSAPITQTRCLPVTTLPHGPGRQATLAKLCACSRNCSPTRKRCSAPITQTRCAPEIGYLIGKIEGSRVSCSPGTQNGAQRFANGSPELGFSQVEVGVMRLGTVVHRMSSFESCRGRDAVRKEPGQIRFGGDKIVGICNVDPPKSFWRVSRRLGPQFWIYNSV